MVKSGRRFQKEARQMENPTVKEICDAYIADRRNPFADRPCKHADSLLSHLKAPIALWGAIPINEFRQGSRQRVKLQCEEWRRAGLSAHTIRKRVSILKTAFKFAVDEELIERGQEPVIKLPPNGAPRERVVDVETELSRLLVAMERSRTPLHIRTLVHLLLRTGVRRGAALALQWDHVDFERREIRFRDTEAASERTKKRRGNKPMTDALYDVLQLAFEARDEGCPFVIQYNGRRVKNPYHALKQLYKRAGMTDLWTHDLRRSSATYVHTETDGDLTAAANHITDTEATARKHYVQENVRVHLPAMNAVDRVIDRARLNGKQH
jgi:integrase